MKLRRASGRLVSWSPYSKASILREDVRTEMARPTLRSECRHSCEVISVPEEWCCKLTPSQARPILFRLLSYGSPVLTSYTQPLSLSLLGSLLALLCPIATLLPLRHSPKVYPRNLTHSLLAGIVRRESGRLLLFLGLPLSCYIVQLSPELVLSVRAYRLNTV